MPPPSRCFGLDKREAQWVARVLGLSIEDLSFGKPIKQKASVCLPLRVSDGQTYFVKKGDTGHLDAKRRARTGRSLRAERAFYALPRNPQPLLPLALGAFLKEAEPRSEPDRFSESQTLGIDLGVESEFLLILQDAHHIALPSFELRQVEALPGGLTIPEARAAIRWLAQFHDAFLVNGSSSGGGGMVGRADVWPQGGYWTYAKRAVISPSDRESSSFTLPNDLTPSIICKEWECLLDRVGGAAPELRDLREGPDLSFSRALSESSGALSRLLSQGSSPSHKSATIVHGDYKAANIFLDKSGHMASTAVDFQWTGYGYGTTDLLYLLATSLSSSALEEPWQNWLDYYYNERGGGESQEGLGRREDFGFQADLAMADYTRYLVGEMWSRTDLESIQASKDQANIGMHKRSIVHLSRVAREGAMALERLYLTGIPPPPPLGRWVTSPRLPKKDSGPSDDAVAMHGEAWRSAEPLRMELARLFGCILCLGEIGGGIVRELAETTQLDVRNKDTADGFDPQTNADVTTEVVISAVLRTLFPDVAIIGEEGVEGSEVETPTTDSDHAVRIQRACEEVSAKMETTLAPWEIQVPDGVTSLRDVTIWIDPLDGTREVLRGDREGVTCLIGAAAMGTPWFGVINQPWWHPGEGQGMGRTVWGGQGIRGVYAHATGQVPANATPVPPPQPSGRELLTMVTTRSHGTKELEDSLSLLGDKVERIRVGGAGRKVLMLIDGAVDAYVFPANGTKRWDTCAGESLLRCLGGSLVKATDGSSYSYDAEVAADPYNREGVVATIHHSEGVGPIFRGRL